MKTPSRDLWNSESKQSIPANESRRCHLPATVTLSSYLYMTFLYMEGNLLVFYAYVVKSGCFEWGFIPSVVHVQAEHKPLLCFSLFKRRKKL